jgi:hypothetical protein
MSHVYYHMKLELQHELRLACTRLTFLELTLSIRNGDVVKVSEQYRAPATFLLELFTFLKDEKVYVLSLLSQERGTFCHVLH